VEDRARRRSGAKFRTSASATTRQNSTPTHSLHAGTETMATLAH
jgi:hypothetical protein